MKDDRVYLEHIRDALRDITTYASAGRDAFFAERMRQDATLRKLEVIGQAVKNLSKARRPRIPGVSEEGPTPPPGGMPSPRGGP